MFEDLKGKIITEIIPTENTVSFITAEGVFELYHEQDCCERVYVDDICGDLCDLVGEPILLAEESSNGEGSELLWTFYKLATNTGSVTITFRGDSNGYYTMAVSFRQVYADNLLNWVRGRSDDFTYLKSLAGKPNDAMVWEAIQAAAAQKLEAVDVEPVTTEELVEKDMMLTFEAYYKTLVGTDALKRYILILHYNSCYPIEVTVIVDRRLNAM